MVWTPAQRERLAVEKMQLEKYFLLGVTWMDPQHKTKVEVLLKSNSNREYILRINIPDDFPNSCPVLVVVSPPKLLLKNGSRLPEASYTFHTLVDTDGFHRICHFFPPDWTQDITLYQVFIKGRLWIEGYEAHLRTGKKMDAFLGEQKYTPRPQNARNNQREGSTATSPAEQQREVRNSPSVPIIGRSSLGNTSSARYGNLSDEQVPPYTGYNHFERDPISSRCVNELVDTPRNCTAIESQRRNTYSTPSNSRNNDRNPTRSNSLSSYISPLSTASCYVNEPALSDTPRNSAATERRRNAYSSLTSNTRRDDLNPARSNSLSSYISPPSTASYVNEPVFLGRTPRNSTAIERRRNSELEDPSSAYTTAPLTTMPILPTHSPTLIPRRASNGTSNQDLPLVSNNNEETSPQLSLAPKANNTTPSRYRPAGGVNILAPFSGQNVPISRHVSKLKPIPKPRTKSAK